MRNILRKFVVNILTLEARVILSRCKPVIIAVTGSIGKTTTKDLIYSILSSKLSIKKNNKSYNSEFGVPLTILGLESAWRSPLGWILNILSGLLKAITYYLAPNTFPKYLVLEVGADHPEDIKRLVRWLRPEMGVVTGLGNEVPVHVEFFKNIDELVEEKSNLLRALSRDGQAIVNRDDARAWEMRSESKAPVTGYGFSPGSDILGSDLHITYSNSGEPTGMVFRLDYDGKSVPVRLSGVLGKGSAYGALGAATVGLELGINLIQISEALSMHPFAPGRMRILAGINGAVLIDDTYNSSPAAVRMALDTLHEIKSETGFPSRKIAVLGDMLELGEYSEREHKKVGEWLRGVADVIVCVGPLAHIMGESALVDGCEKRQVHFFATSTEAGDFLKTFVQPGDTILLKASQSIRLERATELLLADPSLASSLLVRKEKEWKSKK